MLPKYNDDAGIRWTFPSNKGRHGGRGQGKEDVNTKQVKNLAGQIRLELKA